MTTVFSPLFQKYKHGTEGEKTKVEKESERESKTGGGGVKQRESNYSRGERERLQTPLNKSELQSNLSVSRLFLLVTKDQLVLVTGVSLCVIGWSSGQRVCAGARACVCVCVRVWKDSINNTWIGATGRDKESC